MSGSPPAPRTFRCRRGAADTWRVNRGSRWGRTSPDGGPGSRWLRLGCLLAAGQLVVLVALVAQSGGPSGAKASSKRIMGSAGGDVALPPVRVLRTPATTVPVVPTTTAPPGPVAPPAAAVPVAPTPTPAAPAVVSALVPPAHPASNIAPQPDFLQSCSGTQYDGSAPCTSAVLAAIANARHQEGLGALALPTNWAQLSPERQLFVATNLERTARGLPPMTAMASALDQGAEQGAAQDTDPPPPGGFPYSQWGSNWAGAVGNPLEAMYFWMYDDGLGSANIECTPSNARGCWGHRANVLIELPCRVCVMGAGWAPQGYQHDPSMTEILVESSGSPATDFTWQEETAYLTG